MSSAHQKSVLVAIPCLLLGGTEYQTLNLVRALREGGYRVTVLCYFEHDPRMVEYMRASGAEVMLMSPSGARPSGAWPMIITLWRGFAEALRICRPSTVHVQYMAPGSLAILLFKLLGVRHILATAHVPGHIYSRKWIPRLLSRYVCDLFLCVSRSSEEAFFDTPAAFYDLVLQRKGRSHFTLYNCTDIPDIPLSLPECSAVTIGVVSRLSHEKGIDRLIEAALKVLENHPNTRFLIVGDGKHRETLEALSTSLNVAHAFTWAGLQPKEALMSYYAQMDIVAIPSRFEGFGLTAIEAMSYARPVVASHVDGLAEVVSDGESGILFDPESRDALADALIHLIEHPHHRQTMGNAGYSRVKALFSYNIYQKTISDIYTNLT